MPLEQEISALEQQLQDACASNPSTADAAVWAVLLELLLSPGPDASEAALPATEAFLGKLEMASSCGLSTLHLLSTVLQTRNTQANPSGKEEDEQDGWEDVEAPKHEEEAPIAISFSSMAGGVGGEGDAGTLLALADPDVLSELKAEGRAVKSAFVSACQAFPGVDRAALPGLLERLPTDFAAAERAVPRVQQGLSREGGEQSSSSGPSRSKAGSVTPASLLLHSERLRQYVTAVLIATEALLQLLEGRLGMSLERPQRGSRRQADGEAAAGTAAGGGGGEGQRSETQQDGSEARLSGSKRHAELQAEGGEGHSDAAGSRGGDSEAAVIRITVPLPSTTAAPTTAAAASAPTAAEAAASLPSAASSKKPQGNKRRRKGDAAAATIASLQASSLTSSAAFSDLTDLAQEEAKSAACAVQKSRAIAFESGMLRGMEKLLEPLAPVLPLGSANVGTAAGAAATSGVTAEGEGVGAGTEVAGAGSEGVGPVAERSAASAATAAAAAASAGPAASMLATSKEDEKKGKGKGKGSGGGRKKAGSGAAVGGAGGGNNKPMNAAQRFLKNLQQQGKHHRLQ